MAKVSGINSRTLQFLKGLSSHNNREWFTAHKADYEAARENVLSVVDELILAMNTHDVLETRSGREALFRIYNDVRFKKDKTPYKDWFGIHIKRSGMDRRGGYYFQIKPGESFLGVGFWAPEPDDLKRIREAIAWEYPQWKKMLSDKKLVSVWGSMQGDQLKTAPKGFDKDHPAVEWLRYKQYIFSSPISDKELASADLPTLVDKRFRAIRPFLDYMSEVLTQDGNGEKIL